MERIPTVLPLGYESTSGAWTHPPRLVDHFGKPLPADMVFFRQPPIDLGGVISGHSTMRRGRETISITRRLFIVLAISLPITALLTWLIEAADSKRDYQWCLLFPAALCVITAILVWRHTAFRHACTFVCVDGMVWYQLEGSLNAAVTESRLIFRNATELRTIGTIAGGKGLNAGDEWEFKWTNAAGQLAYSVAGKHENSFRKPKLSDPYSFAASGEVAWTNYLLRTLDAQLRQDGYVEFNAGGPNDIRVGRGFLEFKWGNEVTRIASDEIKMLHLHKGKFHIAHNDAGWFGRKGKFDFQYESMANVRLFLMTIDRLLGLKLTP